MEQWLDKLCRSLPLGEKHYLILDNASFHRGGNIKQIVESYGHSLMYLPPYSPELNPIEKCWGVLKQKIRLLLSQNIPLIEALDIICSY